MKDVFKEFESTLIGLKLLGYVVECKQDVLIKNTEKNIYYRIHPTRLDTNTYEFYLLNKLGQVELLTQSFDELTEKLLTLV